MTCICCCNVVIHDVEIGGHCLTTFQSAALSSTFDVGAMIGKCSDIKMYVFD